MEAMIRTPKNLESSLSDALTSSTKDRLDLMAR